jgi:hypothetical protein
MESAVADDLRRKALLTHGPATSVKRREEKGNSRSRARLGLRWLARLGPGGNAGRGETGHAPEEEGGACCR